MCALSILSGVRYNIFHVLLTCVINICNALLTCVRVLLTCVRVLLTCVHVLLTGENVITHERMFAVCFKHYFKIFKVCKDKFHCRDSNSGTLAFLAL